VLTQGCGGAGIAEFTNAAIAAALLSSGKWVAVPPRTSRHVSTTVVLFSERSRGTNIEVQARSLLVTG
jgi:hypothetical protein